MRRRLIQCGLVVVVVILGCGRGGDPGRQADDGAPGVAGTRAAERSTRGQRLGLLEAPRAATWTVTERPLEAIGGDSKVVESSWTVSDDGNHFAFAIGTTWHVDGDRRVALLADDEKLEREFADREGHQEVIDGTFFAEGPGRLTFTATGGRFVVVAPAVTETWYQDDIGHRLRGNLLLLAFWKDGEFCGVMDGLRERRLWGSDSLGNPGYPITDPTGKPPAGFERLPIAGGDVLRNDLGLVGVTTAMLGGIDKGMLFLVVDLNATGADVRCLFHDAHANSGFALPGTFQGSHARYTHVQFTDDGMRWLGVRDGSTKIWSISGTASQVSSIAAGAGVADGRLLANGGTLLIGESRNEGCTIVFNGVPQKRFAKLVGVRTSPDGRHYVAITAERGKAFALVDNEVTELPLATREILPGVRQEFVELRGLCIDDEANWRALISIGTDVVHLENGNVLGTYAWTGAMALEDGSARYAFAAIDEREDPRAKQVILTPMLVVDGRASAVEGLDPVTIDQQEDGMQTLMARGMAAASLAEHLGDAVALGPGGTSVLTWKSPRRDQDSVVRINGRVLGGAGHALHPDVAPQLSPNGRDALFVAKAQGEWKLLANGEALAGYDEIGVGGTRVGFTPQGSFTFLASRAGTYLWVEAKKAR